MEINYYEVRDPYALSVTFWNVKLQLNEFYTGMLSSCTYYDDGNFQLKQVKSIEKFATISSWLLTFWTKIQDLAWSEIGYF